MFYKSCVFICILYIAVVDCNLAPFIKKCKVDDSKCIRESTQSVIPKFATGISELKLQSLDPLHIDEIDSSKSGLKFIVTNLTVLDLKECEAKKTEIDKATMKLTVKVLCKPNLEGKYDMKGQLFVVPIEGNGVIRVVIKKILINVEADLGNKTGKDGKEHWTIKRWKHTFELQDKSEVKFENLFPNNALLRKTTENLVASNGNDIITEIGPPIIKAIVSKVIETVAKFLKAVPLEDLILGA